MYAPVATNISSPSSSRLAFAAIVAANVVFGFGPWLVRLADVGPVAAGFWRLALPLPILAALALRGRGFATLSRRTWSLLAFGGACFAADLALWHVGILHTRLGNATLFGNVSSFLFPFYGFIVARALPERNQSIALALAAVGVALLLGRSYQLSPAHLLGDILCLTAGGFYTIYLIAIDRSREVLPLPALTIATAAGTLPLLATALLLGERVLPGDWTPLLLLAGGSQLIGQGLVVYAIGRLTPLVVGLGLLLQPIVAAAIGWLVFGERLGLLDLVGAAAIAGALMLVRRRGVEKLLKLRLAAHRSFRPMGGSAPSVGRFKHFD
jgi:drug/metabolite transporter (DMT)-like permease